ncbi:MAG: hypothetical protein ACRC4G_05180 [Alphaproteobacteria bacterium]
MLERFWTFSLFIIEALKKEKKNKIDRASLNFRCVHGDFKFQIQTGAADISNQNNPSNLPRIYFFGVAWVPIDILTRPDFLL